MNTEKTFFEGKRPWSRIKDSVLREYLPAYLSKVAKLSQRIILIDAFAGPGIFDSQEGKERLGSPLIILQSAEKHVPGEYFAIFVNSNKNHHKKLKETIKEYNSAKALLGNAQELLEEIKPLLTNQTVFLYLDPFGLKDLDFDLIRPFLERDISHSTEILINMSIPTLHRLATRKLQQNGVQTVKSMRFNQDLTKVLGGDYWKEIMWNDSLAKEREIKVMEKYRGLLKNYLPYAGSCPVSEKRGRRVKYFITFCSRHHDAMRLMNDAMSKAYFQYMHEREYEDTLFQVVDWKNARSLNPLKKIIVKELKADVRKSRRDLWDKIIQGHFMEFHSSEYKEAVRQLIVNDKRIKYQNPRKTGRLNDECILFLGKSNGNPNTNSGLLSEEGITDYPRVGSKVHSNRIKVHFGRYKTIDGKTKILVSRVNDGSIITRFDKTPLPRRSTDVICPHFVELKWAYGCPFDCSWCYLKGTFRFRPDGIKPVVKDLEKVKLHVQVFLDQVKEPEILNTGELADSLMAENGRRAFSRFIIPMFESQSKHKVLFVTKSNNVKNLLQINPHNQVIVSFSLNAGPAVKLWERKAPTLLQRLKAAEKLFKSDYEVRIRIDPMVPIHNWEKSYRELVDNIFSRLTPERITIGSLRGLQSTVNSTKDRSWVHYLKETSNWGKKIDFTTRLRMYSSIMGYLKNEYGYSKVALCKETTEMWQKLGMEYKNIKCNCIW